MFYKTSDTNENFAVQQEYRRPLAKSYGGRENKHKLEMPKPIQSQIPREGQLVFQPGICSLSLIQGETRGGKPPKDFSGP